MVLDSSFLKTLQDIESKMFVIPNFHTFWIHHDDINEVKPATDESLLVLKRILNANKLNKLIGFGLAKV